MFRAWVEPCLLPCRYVCLRVRCLDNPVGPPHTQRWAARTRRSPKPKGAGLIATWHLISVDQVRLSEELCGLDARQHALDRKVREAADRQRYSADPAQKAQAAQDEAAHVAEMDRLMTRMGG